MQRKHKFSANVKMSDLIISDHSLLLVISRFGIPLGFGDKTISEVWTAKVAVQNFEKLVKSIIDGKPNPVKEGPASTAYPVT